MNIFALHWRQRKAARWHCDKHVVKMLLETVQLLYTAHWVLAYPELRDCRSAVGLARRQRQLAVPASMALASAPVWGGWWPTSCGAARRGMICRGSGCRGSATVRPSRSRGGFSRAFRWTPPELPL